MKKFAQQQIIKSNNLHLFSDKDKTKILHITKLPSYETAIYEFIPKYCTLYGSIIFIDTSNNKICYLMNWNTTPYHLEHIKSFLTGKLSYEQFSYFNSLYS